MNKTEIMTSLTRNVNWAGLQLKKHSPQLLIGAGVVGVVISAVMACKATIKANDVVQDAKYRTEEIHKSLDAARSQEETTDYTEEQAHKELAIVHVRAGVELLKLYGPSVALGTISIASILASNNILNKRNVALAAAYKVVDTSFKEYRGRLIERFGKELDRELKYNIKTQTIEETVTDEKGEEKVVERAVSVITDPNTYSEYARFYDDGCKGWTKSPEDNFRFLKIQQSIANKMLKDRGYLPLNEVYEMLGIPKTKAGHVVGWVYNEKHPVGDNFVDFGIFDANRATNRDFVNGYERTILLDFNVDGVILDLIERW